MIVIGIDPGTGVSSPMGLGAFNPVRRTPIHVEEFWTKWSNVEHRIRDISDNLEATLLDIVPDEETPVLVCIEYFVMRGKGGETLQRMVGSVMGRLPYNYKLVFVQNTTVKAVVGGSGKADKRGVAEGVLDFFGGAEWVRKLIEAESWDILDALAIGIAGWIDHTRKSNSKAVSKNTGGKDSDNEEPAQPAQRKAAKAERSRRPSRKR